MFFSQVQHQERALSLIRRALRSGRRHHAFLFDGPEGVGKELTARALAAAQLCEQPDRAPEDDACGVCTACELFKAGTHSDFHVVHRELHTRHPDRSVRNTRGLFLTVDVVRHFLLEPASLSPSRGRARLFVIRDAERMNPGAQNALLKTLEEPPGRTALILVTSAAGRLLETIRSRCQRIPFERLPRPFVETSLKEAGVAADDAAALAALSEGGLGLALRWDRVKLLDRISDVEQAWASLGDISAFAKQLDDSAKALGTALQTPDEHGEDESADIEESGPVDDTDARRAGMKLLLMLLSAALRDALVSEISAGSAPLLLPRAASLRNRIARKFSAEHIELTLDAISQTEARIDRNVALPATCEWLAVAIHDPATVG